MTTQDDGVGDQDSVGELAFEHRYLQVSLPCLDLFRAVPEKRRDEFIVRAASLIRRSERSTEGVENEMEWSMEPILQELRVWRRNSEKKKHLMKASGTGRK